MVEAPTLRCGIYQTDHGTQRINEPVKVVKHQYNPVYVGLGLCVLPVLQTRKYTVSP